jgi:hypothetical protein
VTTLSAQRAERGPQRGAVLILGCGTLVWLVGILLVVVANAVSRPHLAYDVHIAALALGLLSTLAGVFIGVLARSSSIKPLGLVGGVATGLFADGSLVLVNQLADAQPARMHTGTLVLARPERMRVRATQTFYEATTDLVASVPELHRSIALNEPKYVDGTYPVGSKVRVYARPGALGFAWLEKYELD